MTNLTTDPMGTVTNLIPLAQQFIDAAIHSVDPLFIAFYVVAGAVLGFGVGYLFIGVGKTEQRLIGQNYASGYRKGWSDGRHQGSNYR
jgi:hypothetical protein